jgi:hypothetical protein
VPIYEDRFWQSFSGQAGEIEKGSHGCLVGHCSEWFIVSLSFGWIKPEEHFHGLLNGGDLNALYVTLPGREIKFRSTYQEDSRRGI